MIARGWGMALGSTQDYGCRVWMEMQGGGQGYG